MSPGQPVSFRRVTTQSGSPELSAQRTGHPAARSVALEVEPAERAAEAALVEPAELEAPQAERTLPEPVLSRLAERPAVSAVS